MTASSPFPSGVSVVLVEDDENVRIGSVQALELAGFDVAAFADAEAALARVEADAAAIVVTDVRLPRMSGLDLQARLRGLDPDLPVIVVTGHGDIDMAVGAMRAGAYDFIEKPFTSERLADVCRRAVQARFLILENRRLRAEAVRAAAPAILGHSPAIERVRAFVAAVGPSPVDVLITGDTGTGKEVVARALHDSSGRKGPFVALNCGALPESVFESELFGHEAGAFTGAVKRRVGRIEYASGGTLFLDEIESMPLGLQVKLLRVLQERVVERLGENRPVQVDLRVVAAAKGDLRGRAEAGTFRSDLYFRLGVAMVDLPPLDARKEDIPVLAAHFAADAALRLRRAPSVPDAATLQLWMARNWPGNVRELRNAVERHVLGLPEPAATAAPPLPPGSALPDLVNGFERTTIERALAEAGGSVRDAAERLGIPRKTLYDKMAKLGLNRAG